MEKRRLGLIGVGARGRSHLDGILTERDDVVITWICDKIRTRAEEAAKVVTEKMGNTPQITEDWRRLIEQPDVDAVVIASDWDNHVPATCMLWKPGKRLPANAAPPIRWTTAGSWYGHTKKPETM